MVYALTGNDFFMQQCFLLICMPWRAMIFQFNDACYLYVCPNGQWFHNATMFSIDMYALTGNCFSIQWCFLMICMPWRAMIFLCYNAFYWYVCPDGQWFFYATMFSIDMYALTGNCFSIQWCFLMICMPWRAMDMLFARSLFLNSP